MPDVSWFIVLPLAAAFAVASTAWLKLQADRKLLEARRRPVPAVAKR